MESILKFKEYIVEDVIFKNNDKFDNSQAVKLDLKINEETKKENNILKVDLNVTVFEEAEKNNYPFYIKLRVRGIFQIEGNDEDVGFFKPNAIAILFPYVRAIISTYTGIANINPLILPAINVNKLLENNK